MKRLGIISAYDSDGKIYPYLVYYLKKLKEVVDYMIIVFNGELQIAEKEKLKCFAEKVYERENIGYDSGAYKYVFEQILCDDEWNNYDEIVLSNDTCFGPFQSFEEIFNEMEESGSWDFWGINGIDDGVYKYLQSNFIVLKKQVFDPLRKYFNNFVDEYTDVMHEACIQYERGLFVNLINEGFRERAYVEYNNLDAYNSSYYLVKDYNCPFMKKKVDLFRSKTNALFIIKYLQENYDYDTSLIVNYYKEKYGVDLEDCKITNVYPERNYLKQYNINRSDIEEFIEYNKDIYIYGIGKESDYLWIHFKNKITNLKGFVISDDQEVKKFHHESKVYKVTQIVNKDVGIIVALNSKNTEEVRRGLVNYHNVLYLSK